MKKYSSAPKTLPKKMTSAQTILSLPSDDSLLRQSTSIQIQKTGIITTITTMINISGMARISMSDAM